MYVSFTQEQWPFRGKGLLLCRIQAVLRACFAAHSREPTARSRACAVEAPFISVAARHKTLHLDIVIGVNNEAMSCFHRADKWSSKD
jgi:hypothetical protein